MGRAQIEALEVVGGVFFVAFGLIQTKVLKSSILGFDLLMPLLELSGGGDTATITPAMAPRWRSCSERCTTTTSSSTPGRRWTSGCSW